MFDRSLRSGELWARTRDGKRRRLPVRSWQTSSLPGDRSLLGRCASPTLDVGCGPGRLAAALHAAGVHALGVDISPQAVEQARTAGASAICRSIFDEMPASGQWRAALLADGNVGIGGDPVALLRRVRSLLAPQGVVLAEVASPGQKTGRQLIQLDDGHDTVSAWFPWAQVGVDDTVVLAAAAGLHVTRVWSSAGRWFTELRRSEV